MVARTNNYVDAHAWEKKILRNRYVALIESVVKRFLPVRLKKSNVVIHIYLFYLILFYFIFIIYKICCGREKSYI